MTLCVYRCVSVIKRVCMLIIYLFLSLSPSLSVGQLQLPYLVAVALQIPTLLSPILLPSNQRNKAKVSQLKQDSKSAILLLGLFSILHAKVDRFISQLVFLMTVQWVYIPVARVYYGLLQKSALKISRYGWGRQELQYYMDVSCFCRCSAGLSQVASGNSRRCSETVSQSVCGHGIVVVSV